MKTLSNSLLRSVFSLVIGVLLVIWPEAAMEYLIITIGVLFVIPGLISLLGYFAHRTEVVSSVFPVASLGSALLGLWLMIMPRFFVNILMYILGAILVLAGIQLIVGLISARRSHVVPVGYYIMPMLILLAGVLVLLNPFTTASIPFIILGVSCIFYSISDIITYFVFYRQNSRIQNISDETGYPVERDELNK